MAFNFGAAKTPTTGGFSFKPTTPGTPAAGGFSFSSSAAKPSTSSFFGSGSTFGAGSAYGAKTPAQQQQQQLAQRQQQLQQLQQLAGVAQTATVLPPMEAVQTVENAYTVENGEFCRFRHMLYNRVDDAKKYARPVTTSQLLWDQAQRLNPDPDHLVPVEARGFADLRTRVAEQDRGVTDQLDTVKQMEEAVQTLDQRFQLSTAARLAEYQRRQRQLSCRSLKALRRLAVLSGRGYGTTGDEGTLFAKLDAMQREWNATPSRLPELASSIQIHLEKGSAAAAVTTGSGSGDRSDHGPRLAGDQLEDVTKHLQRMSKGLSLLVEQVETNTRDLRIINELVSEMSHNNK